MVLREICLVAELLEGGVHILVHQFPQSLNSGTRESPSELAAVWPLPLWRMEHCSGAGMGPPQYLSSESLAATLAGHPPGWVPTLREVPEGTGGLKLAPPGGVLPIR